MSENLTEEIYEPRSNDHYEHVKGLGEPRLTHTTSHAYTISPELFEKLYLTPKVHHAGKNIKIYANPTPMGFVGFVISTMTFAMCLMGFGGAGEMYALSGMFMFTGPVLLLLTTVFEWIMGNFFSMMACSIFGVFWLSFAFLEMPSMGIAQAYSASGTSTAEGMASVQYNAAVALYLMVWGFALFTFFIFTVRINVVFASMFGAVTTGSFILAGAYWKVSTADYAMAMKLQKAGGAFVFIAGICGWYMTFVIMAAEMGLFKSLPVGDLSHFFNKRGDVETGEKDN